MRRSRVVAPAVVTLELSDGDYIDVKRVLNAGEYRKLLYDQLRDTGEPTLDVAKVGISKLLAYLVGWNLIGLDGDRLPYSLADPEALRQASIDSLDKDTYKELIQAVDAHEAREEAALDLLKKNRAGLITCDPIS